MSIQNLRGRMESMTTKKLAAAMLGMVLLLAACGYAGKTETIPVKVTPSVVVTENVITKTPTETTTATQEVAPVEQMRIFVEDRIEYGGHAMDFRITMKESDKIVQEAFDYFGFDKISINEKKENARELIAKTLAFSLKDTYNHQNGKNITLEEYATNPEKYPAKIMARDVEGKLVEQIITYDQINELEFRFTSGLDGELFYNYPGSGTRNVGYGFDGETLVYYFPLSKSDPALISMKNKGRIEAYGFSLIQLNFIQNSYTMPYELEKVKEGKTLTEIEERMLDLRLFYYNFHGVRLPNDADATPDERVRFYHDNGIFIVTFK